MISQRPHRFYDYLATASVTLLLCANLIAPAKLTSVHIPLLGDVVMSAGIFFLPLFYACGKITVEVYGADCNRRVIWIGFAALAFAALVSFCVVGIQPAADAASAEYQQHVQAVYGNTPRIILASMAAFLVGSFSTHQAMATLKYLTQGRNLILRTCGATLLGQLMDVCAFYFVAFAGDWPLEQLLHVIVAQYLLKVICGFVLAPVVCRMVTSLKAMESGSTAAFPYARPASHILPG